MKYFFDTYALIEITKKNPNFSVYFDEDITTSIFNLIEFYYCILRDLGEHEAKFAYNNFKNSIVEINDETIFEAMKLKLKNKNLSYVDCLGYNLALKNNLKFLTGDKEFKNMDNVEFVQ